MISCDACGKERAPFEFGPTTAPDERAAAIVRGFEVAYRERRNLSDAIQIGVNYVSML
jgi:hypothetical protein